jgi:hypothetical protein
MNRIDIIITAVDMQSVHRKLTHPKILNAAQNGLITLLLDREGCVVSVPEQFANNYADSLSKGLEGTPGLQIALK